MTTIIGIDPGSQRTVMASFVLKVVVIFISRVALSISLLIRFSNACAKFIWGYARLLKIISLMKPELNKSLCHNNPGSAIKLGQARGAAIVALTIPINEYSARQVKKSVVGHGAADKDQVMFMVKRLLNIQGTLQVDASDALAIALCHAQSRALRNMGLLI